MLALIDSCCRKLLKLVTEEHRAIFSYAIGKSKLRKFILPLPLKTYGILYFRPFTHDIFIIRDVIEREVYEKYFHITEGDFVIDCGAHIGSFTIKAAKSVGSNGLVISIEPEKENYNLLSRNIASFGQSNIVPLNVALSDYCGYVKLFLSNSINLGKHSIIRKTSKYITVPCITVDYLIKKLNITKVDFIKIDVEGAESSVLRGVIKY